MNVTDFHIGLVGPLPPPSGGMANQTQQLAQLLRDEGATVEVIQVNKPYTPQWTGRFKVLLKVFRLVATSPIFDRQVSVQKMQKSNLNKRYWLPKLAKINTLRLIKYHDHG